MNNLKENLKILLYYLEDPSFHNFDLEQAEERYHLLKDGADFELELKNYFVTLDQLADVYIKFLSR